MSTFFIKTVWQVSIFAEESQNVESLSGSRQVFTDYADQVGDGRDRCSRYLLGYRLLGVSRYLCSRSRQIEPYITPHSHAVKLTSTDLLPSSWNSLRKWTIPRPHPTRPLGVHTEPALHLHTAALPPTTTTITPLPPASDPYTPGPLLHLWADPSLVLEPTRSPTRQHTRLSLSMIPLLAQGGAKARMRV